jgi:hypothetical protein
MKNYRLAGAVALLLAPALSHAADITTGDAVSPGYGVNYKAKLTLNKAMIEKDTIVIKTDDVLTPGANTDETVKIPATKSMGWNDTATNPDIASCSATVTTNCITIADVADKGFGWGHNSHWYLLDLNQLAGQKVHLHIVVERYNDGNNAETSTNATTGVVTNLPSDDDLIPALTAWKGYQDKGTHLHWFPNKHQTSTKPFWAGASDYVTVSSSHNGKLSKPVWVSGKNTYKLEGTNSAGLGYDTAFGATDTSMAEVSGLIQLSKKDPKENYVTIAVGGDGRHAAATGKHDVNYKLSISLHKAN